MISVLLPVRDGAPWIREAVRSLLEQSLPPEEILVGDDGSEDGTPEIVESMGSPRITVVRGGKQGISRTWNALLERARGRYVARMDADDISLPDRFQVQMEEFRASDVSVLGSWARRFGESDLVHSNPATHAGISAKLSLSCAFVNPTVVFDRERLPSPPRLDPELAFAADYDLFARMMGEARFGNIPRVLLLWRQHRRNVGIAPESSAAQSSTVSAVRRKLWNRAGIRLSEDEETALNGLVFQPLPPPSESDRILSAFSKALERAGRESTWCPAEDLRSEFLGRWEYYCLVRGWDGVGILPKWWRGIRTLGGRPSARVAARIAAKSIAGRLRGARA